MKLNQSRILFVDDEPGIRDIFEKWLLHAGCATVVTAANGEEALAALAAHPFDLLVSDIRMPKVDGITLVRRRWEAGGHVPCVIFISGFNDIVEREMYSLGVEAFLPKPTRREDFFNTINRSLAERSELWGTQSAVRPRQLLTNCTPQTETLPGGVAARALSGAPGGSPSMLGRGGFSLAYPRPAALGRTGFDLSFGPELPSLKGEGFIRWRSREQGILGVEFEFLDPLCRQAVADQIERMRPASYIPDPLSPSPILHHVFDKSLAPKGCDPHSQTGHASA